MKYYVSGHIQSGIYKITNKVNKKYYIGSACDLYKRYKEHRSALVSNRHHNKQLTRFVNKYSIDNLEFCLLEECTPEELEFEHFVARMKSRVVQNMTQVCLHTLCCQCVKHAQSCVCRRSMLFHKFFEQANLFAILFGCHPVGVRGGLMQIQAWSGIYILKFETATFGTWDLGVWRPTQKQFQTT